MSVPWEVRRFDTLASTNDYLASEARRGAGEGLVAVADHQTAGRGRRGRQWEAPPGRCLLASVLLRPVLTPDRLFCCTAAVAVAAADACRAVAGVAPRLKWPNDLVVDDRKLAGVLAEADPGAPGGAAGSTAVVVGIGCNIDWPGPPGAAGTSLADHAPRPPSRDELLEAWLAHLGPWMGALGTEVGRGQVVDEVRRRSATLGRRVRVTVPAAGGGLRTLVGTAVGLGPDGGLVLDADGGRIEVSVGDVVHLRDGSGPPGPTPGTQGAVAPVK